MIPVIPGTVEAISSGCHCTDLKKIDKNGDALYSVKHDCPIHGFLICTNMFAGAGELAMPVLAQQKG